MGNCSCCRVTTSAVDDEDRGSVEPESVQRWRNDGKARAALENLKENAEISSRLVKIKITRKQLQELLRRGDTQGCLLAPAPPSPMSSAVRVDAGSGGRDCSVYRK